MLIFIPGKTPSSKNSRIRTRSGLFIASKATQLWRKFSATHWTRLRKEFVEQCIGKDAPVFVGMHFVRGTKHKWDFNNPCQTIQDEMTFHKWIEDDDSSIMLPVPLKIDGAFWSYDKINPGCYIRVLSSIEEAGINFSKKQITECII